ncbi:PaaI family thioesterase [Nocardia sp. CA-128927]|uniref:PaaI family thioesterase n=1 Tax=Nocardia sp. CA-128927 TaxID=3239975 RepID=UPI003D99E0B6
MTGLAEASDRGMESAPLDVAASGHEPEGAKSAHGDQCFGCGPGNRAGVAMVSTLVDGRLVGTCTFDEKHQGAPGLAHGGVVAAVLDEASGSVPTRSGIPAVTAKLTVNYVKPAPLHRQMTVSAHVDRREGARKLHIYARLELDGELIAESDALFIVVSPDHFRVHGAKDGELPFLGV